MKIEIKKVKNERQGFTLVEMIVVIVILAIVAAITVPAFTKYIDSNKAKQCVIYRKSLVSRLEEARVTNRNAAMSDVIAKYTDLVCPAGGVYTAKDANTVQCDLHGETATIGTGIGEVAMNTPGNAKPNTGQEPSGGGSTAPTEKEEPVTEPDTESTETPTEAPAEETEAKKETEAPEPGNSSVSPNGKSVTINGTKLGVGTWLDLRADTMTLDASWKGTYFNNENQKIFSENGILYVAVNRRWAYRSDMGKSITIAEYNENVKNGSHQDDSVLFYKVNTDTVYDFARIPSEKYWDRVNLGDVIYYNGAYYVAFEENATYGNVQYANNGWWQMPDFDESVDDQTLPQEDISIEIITTVAEEASFESINLNSLLNMAPTQIEEYTAGTLVEQDGTMYIYTKDVILTGRQDEDTIRTNLMELNLNSDNIYTFDELDKSRATPKGTIVQYEGAYYVGIGESQWWTDLGGNFYNWLKLQMTVS